MANDLVELVKGINLSSFPIATIKFKGYSSKVSAVSSINAIDCCYGADCGDCNGGGYCADCADCCDGGGN